MKRKKPSPFVDYWAGRGGMLHRIRVAQKMSERAEKVTKPGNGLPKHRKPSMPKLPWPKDPSE